MEENKTINEDKKQDIKEVIQGHMEKLRKRNLKLGFQVCCHSIMQKITVFEARPGSKSANDYKRLIKDIKSFCETGLATSEKSNSTKLMKEQSND